MSNEPSIHIETAYKKRKVKVHLRFSEETSDKNARSFYNDLKKLYLEKENFRAVAQEFSALKYS